MQSKMKFDTRRIIQLTLAASLASAAWLPSAFAAPVADEAADHVDTQAHADWRENMAQLEAPSKGCFHAAYPSIIWEKVACAGIPHYHSTPPKAATANSVQARGIQTVGNGNDYAAEVSGLISKTVGTFPIVRGVTSEQGEGAAPGEGINGPNAYTLQLNTNYSSTTAACSGSSSPDCSVWQQYVYESTAAGQGNGAAYIQYWLLNYGDNCPAGWNGFQGSCYKNSSALTLPGEAITDLAKMKLGGSATANGKDTLVFADGSDVYTLNTDDSVLDIATVWNQSEFGIFGDGGGATATFNSGSTVRVKLVLTDDTDGAPTCASNAGSTGETNNLTLGKCNTWGGAGAHSIAYTISN